MIDIAICGANGKMGRNVCSCIEEREGCRVVAGIDINTAAYSDFPIVATPAELSVRPDVIVDFSHPSTLDSLLDYALSTGVPIVFASTGYSDEQISRIKAAGEQVPVFFTFNFSLGINLLIELSRKAAEILGDRFDIEIIEKHHNTKIDAPSGTAIMLAEALNEARDNSCHYVYDRHSQRKKREKTEIGIHAVRGGTIVGEHEVIFAGRDEVVTLSHQAASKQVFAAGAVSAAVFLSGKSAGLYTMKDLIQSES